MIDIRVEAEVRPTEDVKRVKKAVLNIVDIPKLDAVDLGDGRMLLVGQSNDIRSLMRLYYLLRTERILDAARNVMLKSLLNNTTMVLRIHKQSAFAGKISFVTYDDESPLGPIVITITSDKIKEIVDWLVPRTSRGRPLWEREIPRV